VTRKEREMIRCRQEQSGIRNTQAYLLKMAVDGRIINVELDSVKDMNNLLSNASNNIAQIAKRVNETGKIYAKDLDDIKERQEEIWGQQKIILVKLNKILETF
jgi:alpha/beta superfamily hydrolase